MVYPKSVAFAPNRRQFLRALGLGCGALMSGCAGTRSRSRDPATSSSPELVDQTPHHVVWMCLLGGFDSLLTVNPKDQSKVIDKIDTCYRYDECVRVGDRLFGPLIGGLAAHAADLCIVHGVRLDTVDHVRGMLKLSSGRSSWHDRQLPIWSILAKQLPGKAAVPVLVVPTRTWPRVAPTMIPMGGYFHREPSPDLSMFASLDADTLGVYQADESSSWSPWFDVMAAQQQELGQGLLDKNVLIDRARIARESAALHRMLSGRLALDSFGDDIHARALRVVYEGLRQEISKVFVLTSPYPWFDTHSDHLRTQRERLQSTFSAIGRFVDALKATRTKHGTLFDQTTIVISSEMGRYPKLNGNNGKDHWPEIPVIMLGKGVRPCTIGDTDDTLRAIPTDYRTGSTVSGERRPIFPEAISSTLLRICGQDPRGASFRDDDVLLPAIA